MLKIKVCGLNDARIAREIAFLGVDAIGLVFCKSVREVNINKALEIVSNLPPFITVAALFCNSSSDYIDEVLKKVPVNVLQFHGDESVSECSKYEMPFIKSVRVKEDTNINKLADEFENASAILLDAYNETLYGGSGEVFDWNLAKINIDLPIILAGGLNAQNVYEAVKIVNPYAVDVSSGVESAKGVKDINKVMNFIKQARYEI